MSWHCPLCTLENRLESPHCQACLSENPALARKPSPSIIPQFISRNVEGFSQAMKGIISSAADIAAKAAEKVISPTAEFHHDVIVLPNGPVVPNPVHPKPPNPMSAVQPYNLNMDMSLSPRQSEEEVRNFDENVVWNCTACTAENQGSSQQCSFCGNQRTVESKRHNRRANSTFYLDSPHSSRDGADSSEDSQNKSLNPNSEEFDAKMCSDITEEVIKRDKRRSEKIYRNIVETCERLKVEFVDPDFPHSKKSIGDLRRHENEAIVGQIPDHFEWLRPSRIYTKEGRAFSWAVFRDPRPSDIEQGSLGDCWLLSAMALIAERPDILEQIVLTKQYSGIGVYQVRVCVDGEWCTVTIDDSFPCNSRSLSLAFARGRKNQLWVPLIEKALAKHLGSYAKLRGGRTLEGLAMLTGAPCEVISLEKKNLDREMLWAQLISAHEASFIMGCSCGSGRRHADENAYKSKGLLTRHAYSILDVRQEGQNRLVHIRNPWGSHVWTGDWSDHWPGWPQNLRQRLLSRENHGSGAFWMSFDDFISYFDSVDIAKIRTYAGWAELRVPLLIGGHSEKKDKVVQLIITEPTEINISLYQKGARTVDDQEDLMVSLHKVSATGKVSDLVARSRREIRAFVSTGDLFLRPGQYVVICHSCMQLGTGDRMRATLAIHSSRPVYADVLKSSPAMLGDSLIEMVMREGVPSDLGSGIIVRYVTRKFGGLIVMVDNTNNRQWAHLKLSCEGSTNVISSRNVLNVADVVPPLSRQILIILSQMEPAQGFSMAWNTFVRFSNKLHLGDLAQPEIDGLVDRSASHTPKIHINDTIQQLHLPRPLFA